MLDYTDFHQRMQHAQTCAHDVTWLVEPLVRQISDHNSLITFEDHIYLSGLIGFMAGRIDEKDALITEAAEHLRTANDLLTRQQGLLDRSARDQYINMAATAVLVIVLMLALFVR